MIAGRCDLPEGGRGIMVMVSMSEARSFIAALSSHAQMAAECGDEAEAMKLRQAARRMLGYTCPEILPGRTS